MKNVFEYIKLIVSNVTYFITGSIIALILATTSYLIRPSVEVSALIFSFAICISIVLSAYRIWLNDKKTINNLQEKKSDKKRLLQLERTAVGGYTVLQITNTGTEDLKNLQIGLKNNNRNLNIYNQNTDLVKASAIKPTIIKRGETLLGADFPVGQDEVTVTGVGVETEKKYEIKKVL